MTREDAKAILARHQTKELAPEARASLLLDWWSIDGTDPGYADLPESLRVELASRDQPADAQLLRYEPLLELALRRSFVGVANGYLESRLAALGIQSPRVEGDPESMVACPCCGYRSLENRGEYEVCHVCFWEDDGSDDPDRLSVPNHMTLREARENFRRLGAVSEHARPHVLPDGKERYAR